MRYLMPIGSLGVLAWMIHSTLNSQFLYKEVVSICIKGAFVLEVILSLNANRPESLNYIQAVSVPLFMSHAVFIRDYQTVSLVLIVGYLASWLFVLKIKFYTFISSPGKQVNFKRTISFSLPIIFFILSILLSWLLFSHTTLGRIKKGGLFLEEEKGTESESGDPEKGYYDLQDKLQKEITTLIPELYSKEDKYEVLGLLSSLIKDSPYILELEKAEQGLIDYFKRPGPGIEEGPPGKIPLNIKNYSDRKIMLNSKRNKDNIMDMLRNNPFNIKERISFLNRINKIQSSNSHQQINKYERELQKIINNSLINVNANRELKESIRRFKEWKIFDIYRQSLDSLKKRIDSLEGEPKEAFKGLAREIEQLEQSLELKNVQKKIEGLKKTMPSQLNELINETEAVLDLKLEMIISQERRKLMDKIKSPDFSEYEQKKLEEEIDNMKDAEGSEDLSKALAELQDISKTKKTELVKESKELLEAKTNLLAQQKKEKIEGLLKESTLTDEQKEEFLKGLEKLESAKDLEKLNSGAKKLETAINEFLNQGFISEETKDKLAKEINELKDLLASQVGLKEKRLTEQTSASGTQRKWEELIENSSLREETKDALRRLTEELSKADTISKVENIKQAIQEELDSLSKEGIRKDEINELKKLLSSQAQLKENELTQQTAFSQTRKKQEELIENSSLREETKDALRRLTEELSKADTISKVENIKQAIQEELDSLLKQGINKEEAERFKQAFNELAKIKKVFIIEKNLSGLREKTEDLRKVNPQEAGKVEQYLRKISSSPSNKELEKNISSLEEYANSSAQESKDLTQESKEEGSLEVHIFPYYLIVPMGSSSALKTIAVYDKKFIKELNSDLEWFSAQPYIASVDRQGVVHALFRGKAQISAYYKGKSSEKVEVVVVDKINEQIDTAVRNELER